MKEKLVDELLNYFIKEENYNQIIPNDYKEKRKCLRGLINIRMPKSIDSHILELEDKLLKIELNEKGINHINDLKEIEDNIILWKGDITTIDADIIVNAGNSDGLGCFLPNHICIDNTIHTYAGIRLRLECNEILKGKQINNGEIIVCNAYNLPCKKIITTVGPQIFGDVTKQDEIDLSNCYLNSLKYACDNNYKSICFPCISTGVFAYPISKASCVAYKTVKDFLKNHNIKVIFNVYSDGDYNEYKKLFKD